MKPTTLARSITENGIAPAADLLGERPEDVPAVERQEREQVDDRERQRDQREDVERARRVERDRLARDLVGADDARDLLARLRVVEDLRDRARRVASVTCHIWLTARPAPRTRADAWSTSAS